MGRVVIFGIREAARLACAYLRADTEYEPAAYAVTAEYLPAERTLDGLPVVPFEAITVSHPPGEYSFLAPMSYRDHNRHRARVVGWIEEKGYRMVTYVSPQASVFPGLKIGENSMILEGCVVSPFCTIGRNVMIQAGCVIAHDAQIGDHAFLAPGVVLAGRVTVGPYAFVGSGACVRDAVRLAEGSFIAMGSVVSGDTQPWSHYNGNPAALWPTGGADSGTERP